MFLISLYGDDQTEVGRDFLRQWQPSGVVLFGYNAGTPPAVTSLTNTFQQTINEAGGLPLFIAVDQEGGVVARLTDGFTVLPTPLLLTAAGSELAYQSGQIVGQELRAVGINMNLAPVADLETNPDNPIIRRRSFGSDPQRAGAALASYVSGLQSAGVIATLKHFPGHGDTTEDSHAELPIVTLDRERLNAVEFEPFRQGIAANAGAVMVAHIWYPALEPIENLPATLSQNIVTGLLREELGFDGLILTDAMDMNAVDLAYSYQDAAIMAVQAGVDLVALGPHVGLETQAQAIQAVIDAVRSGDISETRVRASVERILAAKAAYNVLNWQMLDPVTAAERVNADAHAQIIPDLFAAGTTLVFDHSGYIPLQAEHLTMIYPATRPSLVADCNQYREGIRWVGVSGTPQDEEIAWAVDAARASDVTVVFTLDAVYNTQQQKLVNALPPDKSVVVALWSPYDVTTFPGISTYLASYSPLPQAQPAVCAVLFGAREATGQWPLTLTLP